MKITVESSEEIVVHLGRRARIWKGVNDLGVPVHAYIWCVSPQTYDEAVNARFGDELNEIWPGPDAKALHE